MSLSVQSSSLGNFMDDELYLNSIRGGLKESVDFFASQDKFIRESWVVSNFLTNISVSFSETDLVRGNDPPDVIFCDAQFEVKEILDNDRKRHTEYKKALVRANGATDPLELIVEYSPKDISIQDVFSLVYSVAENFAMRKYSREIRENIDLLCYVNLRDVMRLIETPLPDVTPLAAFGYRSVSFLEGHRSCVLYANSNAPSFLQLQPEIIHRTVS